MTALETRAVLAGAYLPGALRTTRGLTHAVEINDGDVSRVICGRVNVLNLADRHATDPHARPTCSACARAFDRQQKGRQ